MEPLIYIVIGIAIGFMMGVLISKSKNSAVAQSEKETAQQKFHEVEKEIVSYKATTTAQLQTVNSQLVEKQLENNVLNNRIKENTNEMSALKSQLATVNANLLAANQTIADKTKEIESFREEVKVIKKELNESSKKLATANANNVALHEKLEVQKNEIEALGKKFNLEFENIANKILDAKTEKFTDLNKTNLKNILEPLGKNIEEFKKQVDEVYKTESKERFSLGEKVKELAQLNQVISEEAKNLTKALKGEAKTQGRWGEMILESILERSGLRKNEQYFMEHELRDENGNPLKSDFEGKKMRPDVVIKYPDNRNVIIDSKVSLNAFTRLLAANNVEDQNTELYSHLSAIKTHINSLSSKGYDDYDKSLDFVLMFIPSEPAYIAALQCDPDLWNFAYDKRILLLSPTNLITSLKLLLDLWKREDQSQNAKEIAERGAKLFDKFVSFVENLESVGDAIDKAQKSYQEAFKKLNTGNDNLVLQATKLKNLGIKNKKDLPKELGNSPIIEELPEKS